ncbi:acyltransferase [Parahaliea aestuarii]|uniref:N-acetyltransferase n=1 Tax=Parahaliea aestuarii TaxID=1852021 RepID=A0A5C9A194_9GAMM|nr:acyltransferase [Parahaliea aestuarii]TXS94528.1 N-acetyltransferase [Parahaliea aestuarii]
MKPFFHETAVIDEGAKVGEHSRIWHFVHVSSGARIGRHVTIGQNVFVAGTAVIGDHCKVQNNVSIYDNVTLEDYVFCGPSAVFTNVHNPRAHVERKHEYRETLIKRGATLGANCTIVCGTVVGCYAFIGAGAVVTSDVQDFALVVGVPARQTAWISRNGDKIPIPLKGKGEYCCPHTGDVYCLDGDSLTLVDPS